MDQEKQNFWTTTAGVITAVATALGAVATTVALIIPLFRGPAPDPGPGGSTPSATTTVEPFDDGPGTPTPAENGMSLAEWVDQVNARCIEHLDPIVAGLDQLNDPNLSPADPVTGQALRTLATHFAAIGSKLGAIRLPQEGRAVEWMVLYRQRVGHMLTASERWDSGDIQGAGASLLAMSDGEDVVTVGEELGISTCP